MRPVGDNVTMDVMNNDKNGASKIGKFNWNELVTGSETESQNFYGSLFGWKSETFGQDYTIFKHDNEVVGGMEVSPEKNQPARWLPYVVVEDVDECAARAEKLGAKICVDPFDAPTVGRIAVLTDPQGATIGIITPLK